MRADYESSGGNAMKSKMRMNNIYDDRCCQEFVDTWLNWHLNYRGNSIEEIAATFNNYKKPED